MTAHDDDGGTRAYDKIIGKRSNMIATKGRGAPRRPRFFYRLRDVNNKEPMDVFIGRSEEVERGRKEGKEMLRGPMLMVKRSEDAPIPA